MTPPNFRARGCASWHIQEGVALWVAELIVWRVIRAEVAERKAIKKAERKAQRAERRSRRKR